MARTPNDLRLEVLRQYRLDRLPGRPLDELTALAAQICAVPIALITVVDEGRLWCKSRVGAFPLELSADGSFCAQAILHPQELYVVPDTALDPRFADFPAVTADPPIRFYAAAPLMTREGHAIGTLCILDHQPRHLEPSQLDALAVLGRQVMSRLELHRESCDLVESQERLRIVTDNARVGMVILDRERRYVYANRTYAEILELPSPAIVGERVAEILPAVYESQIRPRMDAAFSGERTTYELCKPSVHGDRFYNVAYEPTMVDGEVTMVVVVLTDVTTRKQAEVAAQESGRLSRATIDALSAHICVLDESGEILTTNAAWRQFHEDNRSAAGVADGAGNYLRVCDAVTGPDAEQAAAFAAGIRAVLRGDAAQFTLEYPCHSPSEQRWFVGRVTRLGSDGPARVVVAHENITERKLAEIASQRLAAIVASSDDAILGMDLNGIVTDWNKGAEQIFGYASADMVGTSMTRLIPADRREEEARILGAIRSGESIEPLETLRLTRDGRLIDVSVTASPIRDSDGTIVGVSKVARDISERKRAEGALRASRELLTNVINSAPSYIFATDRQHRYVIVNDAYARFVDLPVESIIGRTHHDIYPAAQADHFVSTNEAIMASGEAVQIDETVLGQAQVTTKFPLRDARGTVTGICGVVTDITARKQAEEAQRASEERFRELAENIREVFWMTDPAKREIHYISPAYEKIWGRPCESLYENPRAWLDAIHPDDRGRVVHAAETHQVLGDYDETYRILQPDGSVRWIHDRAFPVRDEHGRVLRIVGTAEDVTEQRRLEEHFRQVQKMEAIGQLAGGIAHDFNNILAAILGNVELALSDVDGRHPARRSLEEIQRASGRAKHLIQQILTFSRQQPRERRIVALGPLVEEAVGLLRATIPSTVDLVVSIDADAPPVLADPTQIHQVLVNLATNAWHALADGPGRIEVRLENVTVDASSAGDLAGLRPGRFACLVVRDTGRGMDAATCARVFDPFFTTKDVGKGSGLGLSVVHGIVHEHDGAISLVSEPGRGATFRIHLPAASGLVSEAVVASPASSSHGDGKQILFIDDEAPLVELATRMLGRIGFRVTAFTSAAEAIEAFRQDPRRFDVVVTDMNMPGTSGLQVAHDLLELRPDVAILLSSGHVTEALVQRARAAGIREVLYKPGTMSEFGEAISNAIAAAVPAPGD
ncbi:MAG: PAS domain S-box protein [Candidatus Binatia bacterium]